MVFFDILVQCLFQFLRQKDCTAFAFVAYLRTASMNRINRYPFQLRNPDAGGAYGVYHQRKAAIACAFSRMNQTLI